MLDSPLTPPADDTTQSKLMSIARVAIPSMLIFIFSNLSEVINTYFIGRHLHDSRMLAGAGMGNLLISMLCVSVF